MAITAYAPNFTDNVSQITTSDFWRAGPFEYNGAIYIVGVFAQVNVINSGVIQIVKSVDAGATWTVLDSANQPAMAEVSGGHDVDCVRIGNVLHLLCLHPTLTTLRLTSFDLATATYGAIVDGGPTVDTTGNGRDNPGIFEVSADGTRKVIAYYPSATGITVTKFVVYNGAWGAPITASSNSSQIRSITIDATDKVWLIAYKTNTYQAYTFDAANTLAGPISMGFTASNTVGSTGPAIYDAVSDSIIVPVLSVVSPGIGGRLLIGTPSGAPVWTQEVTGNSGNIVDWSYPVYVPAGTGNDAYFVVVEDGGVLVYLQKTAGVWSTRNVLFDPATDTGVPTIATPVTGIFRPLASFLSLTSALSGVGGFPPLSVNQVAANTMYFAQLGSLPAPVTNPGSGGRKKVVLAPNQFDFCLHREYRLFCNIDYDAKGCARLPKCFTVDEREWGDQA